MVVHVHDFVPKGYLYGKKYAVSWKYTYDECMYSDDMIYIGQTDVVECRIEECTATGERFESGFGRAYCRKGDTFDKRVGRKISFGRAIIKTFPLFEEDPLRKQHVKNLLLSLNLELEDWYSVGLTPNGKKENSKLALNKLIREAMWMWFHKTINSPEK